MPSSRTIVAAILFAFALASFGISYLQFHERGTLFNNAYLYASKDERKRMNKKPYFRQSAIVFSGIGGIFLLNALQIMIQKDWVFYVVIGLAILLLVYAIKSTIDLNQIK